MQSNLPNGKKKFYYHAEKIFNQQEIIPPYILLRVLPQEIYIISFKNSNDYRDLIRCKNKTIFAESHHIAEY